MADGNTATQPTLRKSPQKRPSQPMMHQTQMPPMQHMQPTQQMQPTQPHMQMQQPMGVPMQPYIPYPPMPVMSQEEQELTNAKCCLTMCEMESCLPTLYGFGIFFGSILMAIVAIFYLIFGAIDAATESPGTFTAIITILLAPLILYGLSLLLCGIFGCAGKNNRNPVCIMIAFVATLVIVGFAGFLWVMEVIWQTTPEGEKIKVHGSEGGDVYIEAPKVSWPTIIFQLLMLLLYIMWAVDQFRYYRLLTNYKRAQIPQSMQMQSQATLPRV